MKNKNTQALTRRTLAVCASEESLGDAAEILAAYLRRLCPALAVERRVGLPEAQVDAVILTTAIVDEHPRAQRLAIRKILAHPQDAYLIQSLNRPGRRQVVIAGNSKRAIFYGLYDYLRRVFGVFYDFHADLIPPAAAGADPLPATLNVVERSTQGVRSYKPQLLCNYSDRHSPWAWGAARWRRCVEWCVRQRYNTIQLMFFAQSNWIQFDCAPEAQGVPDPYLTPNARIAVAREVIRRCHQYGLKTLIGFTTNGTTFNYLRRHPREETSVHSSPYQGHLCWVKGHDHLLAVAREFLDTYREADGVVLWPSEGLCQCPECRTGKPFLKLCLEVYRYLRRQSPDKAFYMLDWHFPMDDFLKMYHRQLPADVTIMNTHVDRKLCRELALGLPTVHQACVANWDGANATIMAPNLTEMAFRAKHWADRVIGFEAHHVSMFGGEYTIDGFSDLIWDPQAFQEALYRREYIRAVFGEKDLARLDEIYTLLSTAWTSPFHYYAGLPLYDDITGQEICRGKVGGVNLHYELREGIVQLTGGPADLMTTANMLTLGVAALRRAHELARQVKGTSNYVAFLKANLELQYHYAAWIERKFTALRLAKDAVDRARQRAWPAAYALIRRAQNVYEEGAASLDEAARLTRRHPRFFHVIRGISNRGLECQLSDLGLRQRQGLFYSATIAPDPRLRNIGKQGYRRILARLRRAIARRQAVPEFQRWLAIR